MLNRVNSKLKVERRCADVFKPPAAISITHRNIDGHPGLIQLALMVGLPISQRNDVVGHASHMVIALKSNKLMMADVSCRIAKALGAIRRRKCRATPGGPKDGSTASGKCPERIL